MKENIMTKNLLSFAFYEMDIHLGEYFFKCLPNRPTKLHNHPCYELVCVEKEDNMIFIINPPLYDHTPADAPKEQICSLLFSFSPKANHTLFADMSKVKEQIVLEDVFDGSSRIRSIKRLIQDVSMGAMEQIEAELRLLFICLARAVGASSKNANEQYRHMLDLERTARLEEYFNVHLKNPNCSKRELAAEIGVCERQLTRILDNVYGSSFSAILLRSRMMLAEAMRQTGKNASQIFEAIGYSSVTSFRRAYSKYFGHPFQASTNKDISQP